jgi:hypothetical protein
MMKTEADNAIATVARGVAQVSPILVKTTSTAHETTLSFDPCSYARLRAVPGGSGRDGQRDPSGLKLAGCRQCVIIALSR